MNMSKEEIEMTTCNCEHWQVCQTCKPDMFDDRGNMLTLPPPPSREPLEAAGRRLVLELECLLLDMLDENKRLREMARRLVDVMERSDLEQFEDAEPVSGEEWFDAIREAKGMLA